MAEVVSMPRLSDTMTEGVVAKWHKKVGDPVSEGDLFQIYLKITNEEKKHEHED